MSIKTLRGSLFESLTQDTPQKLKLRINIIE